MPSFGEKLLSSFDRFGQLCIGIDPTAGQLKNWGLSPSAESAADYAYRIIDAAADRIGIIKPQVAFFEQFGTKGFGVLEKVFARATDAGLLVIADAKRGDIGSTMKGYAVAWLSKEAAFQVDALTLSPYLGPESLVESVDIAEAAGRGVFILAATSNPEARRLQSSVNAGVSVADQICEFAASRNHSTLGSVGIVIGSTIETKSYGINSEQLDSTPILAPGFGFQGARLDSAASIFGKLSKNVICNVSRSVSEGPANSLVSRIEAAKTELKKGLTQ